MDTEGLVTIALASGIALCGLAAQWCTSKVVSPLPTGGIRTRLNGKGRMILVGLVIFTVATCWSAYSQQRKSDEVLAEAHDNIVKANKKLDDASLEIGGLKNSLGEANARLDTANKKLDDQNQLQEWIQETSAQRSVFVKTAQAAIDRMKSAAEAGLKGPVAEIMKLESPIWKSFQDVCSNLALSGVVVSRDDDSLLKFRAKMQEDLGAPNDVVAVIALIEPLKSLYRLQEERIDYAIVMKHRDHLASLRQK